MIWPFSRLRRRYDERLDSWHHQSERRHQLVNDITADSLELQLVRRRTENLVRALGIELSGTHYPDPDGDRADLHGPHA